MGVKQIFARFTPFYNAYARFKKLKTVKEQKRIEEELLQIRVEFYKQFVTPGSLVFDVGANVGNRVSALLQCNAIVVAIEPQASCVQILRERFGERIAIENVGLNDRIGELEMQIANDSTVSTFSKEFINKTQKRFKYSRWEKTAVVPVTTMQHLIDKYGVPQFCKVDVEGFELQVLKGLQTSIPTISIEYCVPEMQEQLVKCIAYLHNLSPSATYNYSIGESMKLALNIWMSYEEFIQHVMAKKFTETSFGDIYCRNAQ